MNMKLYLKLQCFIFSALILSPLQAFSSTVLDSTLPVDSVLLASFVYPKENAIVSNVPVLADKVCKALKVDGAECFYQTMANKSGESVDIEVYRLPVQMPKHQYHESSSL
ncbi:hypothetical protein PU345_003706 [Enterobacter kobei]|nr:hypothetical protein [Enterobacter kobei]